LAKDTGVDRSSLYYSLKDRANPRLNTLAKVLDYLGYELKVMKSKAGKGGETGKTRAIKVKAELKKEGNLNEISID